MPVSVTESSLPGVLIIEPRVFGDNRGFFYESFNARDFLEATEFGGLFVQDNHSRSSKGVLRGLHYQIQHSQGKLVRVISGVVFDVAVDIRKGSPHFGKWVGIELSAANKRQLWIPPDFAHGFVVISEYAEVLYKATDYYAPEFERSIRWDDPGINIEWPQVTVGPFLSEKDVDASFLVDADLPNFSK